MPEINKEWLDENGFEVLTFDPEWLNGFRNNNTSVEIYMRKLDNKDEGRFFTLLHDELSTIYKVVFD